MAATTFALRRVWGGKDVATYVHDRLAPLEIGERIVATDGTCWRVLDYQERSGPSGGVIRVAVSVPSLASQSERLRLIVFYSERSGRCRRVDGLLAQVLHGRRNGGTFEIVRVSVDERPDLADRFRVTAVPTLLVAEGPRVRRRLVAPRNAAELKRQLGPWLLQA